MKNLTFKLFLIFLVAAAFILYYFPLSFHWKNYSLANFFDGFHLVGGLFLGFIVGRIFFPEQTTKIIIKKIVISFVLILILTAILELCQYFTVRSVSFLDWFYGFLGSILGFFLYVFLQLNFRFLAFSFCIIIFSSLYFLTFSPYLNYIFAVNHARVALPLIGDFENSKYDSFLWGVVGSDCRDGRSYSSGWSAKGAQSLKVSFGGGYCKGVKFDFPGLNLSEYDSIGVSVFSSKEQSLYLRIFFGVPSSRNYIYRKIKVPVGVSLWSFNLNEMKIALPYDAVDFDNASRVDFVFASESDDVDYIFIDNIYFGILVN